MHDLAIVIPTIGGREKLFEDLIISIYKVPGRIIPVFFPDRTLSAKRNYGASKTSANYILFVDDDNTFSKRAIEKAMMVFDDPKIGVVGFVACYHNNRHIICDSGSFRNLTTGFTHDKYVNKWVANPLYYAGKSYEVDEVANAFIVKREVFARIGLFDSENFPMDLDEADFCYRAKKAGYKVKMASTAIVYHNSITYSRVPDFRRPKNAYNMGRNRIVFQKKHGLPLRWIPVFVLAYLGCLVLRGKFKMIPHFMKGVWHGLSYSRNRQEKH